MPIALVFVELGEGVGVFLTRIRYEFLNKYERARGSAGSLGEFLEWFDPFEREYLAGFADFEEMKGRSEHSLLKLSDDVFILGDAEFPLPQLAGETYEELVRLPLWDICSVRVLRAEYGAPIGIFPVSAVSVVEAKFEVRIERLLSGCQLHDYG